MAPSIYYAALDRVNPMVNVTCEQNAADYKFTMMKQGNQLKAQVTSGGDACKAEDLHYALSYLFKKSLNLDACNGHDTVNGIRSYLKIAAFLKDNYTSSLYNDDTVLVKHYAAKYVSLLLPKYKCSPHGLKEIYGPQPIRRNTSMTIFNVKEKCLIPTIPNGKIFSHLDLLHDCSTFPKEADIQDPVRPVHVLSILLASVVIYMVYSYCKRCCTFKFTVS